MLKTAKGECFTFQPEDTKHVLGWNIHALLRTIKSNTRLNEMFTHELDLKEWWFYNGERSQENLNKHQVGIADTSIPVVAVTYRALTHNPPHAHVIADGNHRLTRAYRDGQTHYKTIVCSLDLSEDFRLPDGVAWLLYKHDTPPIFTIDDMILDYPADLAAQAVSELGPKCFHTFTDR